MLSNLSISRILLLASLLFCPLLLFPQGKAVRVSASERDIVLDYYPSAYKPQKVSINAQSYFYFPESELTSKAGEPGLPAESFLIGIPASGSVDVELIEEQLSEPTMGRIAPVPEISIGSDSLHHIERRFGTSAFDRSQSVASGRIARHHRARSPGREAGADVPPEVPAVSPCL